MFGIGIPELILILIVGLIVFGPSKLPEIGRAVGKGLREFRRASSALQSIINAPEEPVSSRRTPTEPLRAETPVMEKTETKGENASADDLPGKAAEPQGYAPPTQESVRAQLEQKKD